MSETIDQLRSQLDDSKLKDNLGELISIFQLLSSCVIGKNYRVPDALIKSIELTHLGQEVFTEVSAKRRLKPNDVKLAIALTVGSPDGLLIKPESDAGALRQAMSDEILARKIQFPYIFGRDLHDLAAERFPEKTRLDNAQTVALLKDLPIGVFQEGRTIVGPFGATESTQVRQISARRSAPGYLCSDETCNEIHVIDLNTAQSSISRTRSFVSDYIHEHHGGTDDENARLVSDAVSEHFNATLAVEIGPSKALFDTLSDAFSEEELRLISEIQLRGFLRADGARTLLSKRLGSLVTNPANFVDKLERPALLQLLLTFKNREVTNTIDAVIRDGRLPIKEYEVRVGRLDRSYSSNDIAEVGPRGVRSYRPSIVSDRMLSLLHRLYYEADILEPADLEYGLGSSANSDPMDLLGLAIRKMPPRDLLRDLILGNRRAAWEAARYLGVVSPQALSRDELLECMLWKLGAPNEVIFTELDRMEVYETALLSAHESSDEEAIRGDISNLFAAVEDALQRSLTFTIWALTQDHFLDDNSFQYDPLPDIEMLDWLDSNAPVSTVALQLKNNGRNTLAPLAAGFGRLAKGLRSIDPSGMLRPADQEPKVCRISPRPFAFRSFTPFLDLTSTSQAEIVTALQDINSIYADEVVAKVRNSTVHGNNLFPSSGEIRLAVERVRQGRGLLSTSGIFPQVYALESDNEDVFGRQRIRYLRDEKTVDIFRPMWPIAPRLPIKMSRLVIFNAASFGAVGPMRFSLKPRSEGESYWDNWPRRWRVERAYSRSDREDLTDGSFGEPVAGAAG